MSSSGGIASDSFASNPANALVAYSRPPIPLAPRLTTASTSQQAIHHAYSTPAAAAADISQSTIARPQRLPRPLIHRASLSTATQALNVDTSPPSARFSAYNTPRPPRHRLQGSLQRPIHDHAGIRHRKSVGSFAFGLEDSSSVQFLRKKRADPDNEVVEDDKFEVLAQFKRDANFPGNVLVRCNGSDFYVHREVLYFASPFFQAVMNGDWKETHPSLHSLSDTESEEVVNDSSTEGDVFIRGSRPCLGDSEEEACFGLNAASPRASFYTADVDSDGQSSDSEQDLLPTTDGDAVEKINSKEELEQKTSRDVDSDKRQVFSGSLRRLATPPPQDDILTSSDNSPTERMSVTSARRKIEQPHKDKRSILAVIDLSEEDASTFQDFLCLVYPNLDLLVTWYNIFPLFSFSDKYEVPHLRRACVSFLRVALAGRPIEAMALGERHGLEDVYREASRHVLENMPSWEPEELEILSSETLLKLERKRTWFLERLLKLGLANPARDYECHSGCSDPPNCARLLHERWRSQYANAFKFGPPQPSIIWRHLRELEGNASFITTPVMSACQSSSKAWVQLLFDRMYGLPTHGMTHPKFLSIKLEIDHHAPVRRRPLDGDMTLPS